MKKKAFVPWMPVLLALLALQGLAAAQVTVPDLSGIRSSVATNAVSGPLLPIGLAVGTVTSEHSATVLADHIISQNPAAGTDVASGTPVSFVVSRGNQLCAGDSIFGQRPITTQVESSIRIYANDDSPGVFPTFPKGFDNFSVTSPICGVTWWGTELRFPTAPYIGAERAAPEFTISFFTNDTTPIDPPVSNASAPNPGTLVQSFTLTANKVNIGESLPNPYAPPGVLNLYRYSVDLPSCVNLNQGWITIQGTAAGSANGNIFIWLASVAPGGTVDSIGGNMREFNGSTLPYRARTGTNYDMSFCLKTTPVTVPNVVNQSQAAASTAITGAGLTVGTVTQQNSNTVAAGNVISQNPAAGASVAGGSAVSLVVSLGPLVLNTVPNVVGQTQAAATTAITGAGLTLGTVGQQTSLTVPAGSVISQNPAAGASVVPGTSVNIVVSLGIPVNVTVPNVVGQTQAAAAALITGNALVVGVVTQEYSNFPVGSVISQNPAAGVVIENGTAVNISVSRGAAPQVPVSGIAGLALLAGVFGALGAARMRRRK